MDRCREVSVRCVAAGNGTADTRQKTRKIQVLSPPDHLVLRHGKLQDDGLPARLQDTQELFQSFLLMLEIPTRR